MSSDPFFLRDLANSGGGAAAGGTGSARGAGSAGRRKRRRSSSPPSSFSGGSASAAVVPEGTDERRVRLARRYLQRVSDSSGGSSSAVSRRLRDDVLERRRLLRRAFAHEVGAALSSSSSASSESWGRLTGHSDSLTAVSIGAGGATALSASKDGGLRLFDVSTRRRLWALGGRRDARAEAPKGALFCCALSGDGRLAAAAGDEGIVRLWDARTAASALRLASRPGALRRRHSTLSTHSTHSTHSGRLHPLHGVCLHGDDLFAAGGDGALARWDLRGGGFLESLYGHSEPVEALSGFAADALSASADGSVRVWRVEKHTQLLYPDAHAAAATAVAAVSPQVFVSGGAQGDVAVWNAQRRKPDFRDLQAHCSAASASSSASSSSFSSSSSSLSPRTGGGCGVTAIAAAMNSDVVISGGKELAKFHRVQQKKGGRQLALAALGEVRVPGFVNAIAIPDDGRYALIGVGREPRLGRWEVLKGVPSALYVLPLRTDALPLEDLDDVEEEEEDGHDVHADDDDDE